MRTLDYLTIALFTLWCLSEIVIRLVSRRNRSRGLSDKADRFSYVVVWFSILPPIWFAILVRTQPIFANGFGSLSTLSPWLGYMGCLLMALGIVIRLIAVATLKKHFTVKVSIVEKHEIVDTGVYGIIRHPAYLGLLASLSGMGLVSENWVSLLALSVLPLAAILYRIYVEEIALFHHFGRAYQDYAKRTKRLLPQIW